MCGVTGAERNSAEKSMAGPGDGGVAGRLTNLKADVALGRHNEEVVSDLEPPSGQRSKNE